MSASYKRSSIPTPPLSPMPSPHDDSHQSTLDLLDSLLDFYHQERAWVQRTRIALKDAFQQVKQSDLPSPPSESESASTSNTECSDELYPHERPHPASDKQPVSQWSRRKKGFKLKLDGLGPHNDRIVPVQPLRRITSRRDFSQRKQILDMLDQMMEARMESCQTINRLVRNANRADLHSR